VEAERGRSALPAYNDVRASRGRRSKAKEDKKAVSKRTTLEGHAARLPLPANSNGFVRVGDCPYLLTTTWLDCWLRTVLMLKGAASNCEKRGNI